MSSSVFFSHPLESCLFSCCDRWHLQKSRLLQSNLQCSLLRSREVAMLRHALPSRMNLFPCFSLILLTGKLIGLNLDDVTRRCHHLNQCLLHLCQPQPGHHPLKGKCHCQCLMDQSPPRPRPVEFTACPIIFLLASQAAASSEPPRPVVSHEAGHLAHVCCFRLFKPISSKERSSPPLTVYDGGPSASLTCFDA